MCVTRSTTTRVGLSDWPPGTTDHTREAFKTLVLAAIEKPGVPTIVSDPHRVALVADVNDQSTWMRLNGQQTNKAR